MPAELDLEVYRADLERVVSMVCETMLEIEVTPVDLVWQKRSDVLTAAVQFAGQWKGAVFVECTEDQACEVAARLMNIAKPALVDEDAVDSIGELANMIGGNMKSVMPRGVELSAPLVVAGSDYALRLRSSDLVTRVAFETAFGPIWITVVEMQEEIGPPE
jgi:chemotaxis protein CheX